MKRWAVLLLAVLSAGTLGWAVSGQGRVAGTAADQDGRPLAGCSVERGLRLGVGSGGFDGEAYATGPRGRFALPVNRGVNRLTIRCGARRGTVTTVVWRGREPMVTVTLSGP